MSRHDLALVHLVRHANGIEPFARFLRSYARHAAGREHELVLLFKGFADERDAAPYRERAADHRPRGLHVADAGLDLTAYFAAAARLGHRYVGFVNSFSEVLAPGWLGLLTDPVASGAAGAVGATGSWASNMAFALFHLGLSGGYQAVYEDRRAVRRAMCAMSSAPFRGDALYVAHTALHAARDIATTALFPSIHLRTNAFVIDRALMLELKTGRLSSKRATYRLENGRGNLTAQLRARGREAVVVDRAGVVRRGPDWPAGDVFWQARQDKLLVADNQTRFYADARPEHRQVLSRFAWGPEARPWLGTT